MPQFNYIRCVLAVSDIEKLMWFYINKSGLTLKSKIVGRLFLSRDNYYLMLSHSPAPETLTAFETG